MQKYLWRFLLVSGAAILALVTILGPIYAFVWVSCTSTRPCSFGVPLHYAMAKCKSHLGNVETLNHGDMCTVSCITSGMLPSSPTLECQDGTVEGMETLVCSPPIFFDNRPLAGGMVVGAITDGEKDSACPRAQYLKCNARAGGTAIFVQLDGLTESACRKTFQECLKLNRDFDFMSHTVPDNVVRLPNVEPPGTCTLGCFEEILPPQALLAVPWQERVGAEVDIFGNDGSQPISAQPLATDGAKCLALSGSCNDGDNKDYYRFPTTTSGFTQWVQIDKSRRIRYDGSPSYSQAGKWILEKGADPTKERYGLTMARQPTFVTWPTLGPAPWRVRCQKQVDGLTVQEDFRMVTISLDGCTCTDAQDCSSHGRSYGSKANGPDCYCTCDRGFGGDHCEITLCEVPYVPNSLRQPCAEGLWLNPGQICTPQCLAGYKSTYPFFVCGLNGRWPMDKLFLCEEQTAQPDTASGEVMTTTKQGPCTDADCTWRGEATLQRLPNGTCVCNCFKAYAGLDCSGWNGQCQAPSRQSIDHAAVSTCKEGFMVSGTCTAQCEAGYWAAPRTLQCRGTELFPPSFICIGGPDVRRVWCTNMQYIAFAASGVAFLGMVTVCICFGRSRSRQANSFYHGSTLVEVEKDDHGKFNIIRADNQEPHVHKLPRAVVSTVASAYAITMDRPVAVENGTHLDGGFDVAMRTTGVVDAFTAQQAAKRTELRSNACVAATEGARYALEVGPLIPPEFVVQVRKLYEGTAEDAAGWPREFGSAGGSVSSTAPPPGYDAELVLPGEPISHGPAEVTMFAAGWGEVAVRPPTPPPPPPSGRFRPGQQVSLTGLVGHQALNGVQGLLVEYDYERGAWVVQLEGFEDELKKVPERHLQEIQLSIVDAVQASRSQWLMERQVLEEKADAARQEHDRQLKIQKAAAGAAEKAAKDVALQATQPERLECEFAIKQAFAEADPEALRAAATRGRELLEQISHCPAAERGPLIRLCQAAESRLEQYEEREDRRATTRKIEERVLAGETANWKLTPKQFWKACEDGDLCKVRGGLKAMQPLSIRSTDGMRYTVLHVACRRVCADAMEGGLAAETRWAIVRELLEARSNPNAQDARDRTPLEYAMAEGGPEAAASDGCSAMLQACRDLGMMTLTEAVASLRSGTVSPAASPSASPGHGSRSP